MPSETGSRAEVLVRLLRAGREESVHRGHLVIQEGDALLRHVGDPSRLVFVRSAIKPLQAYANVLAGAVERYRLSSRSVAIACASHCAAPEHLDAVRETLEASGIPAAALGCGGHYSGDLSIARTQWEPEGGLPSIWNNCSGKHALMLAAAKATGAPLEGYLAPDHPVQQRILNTLDELGEVAAGRTVVAIDGCGAPAPGMPLDALAKAFIRLARLARGVGTPEGKAAATILQAMAKHPSLVAGKGRFDSALIEAGEGRIISKVGAEGVHIALVPDRLLAIAIKVEDGSDRGTRAIVVEALAQLGVLERKAADALRQKFAPEILTNFAGAEVGRMRVEALGSALV